MYTGNMVCPRCKGTHWHRDHVERGPTLVDMTSLVCVKCSERLLVRSVETMPDKYVICRRWTLMGMGKLRPQYREWTHGEPPGTPAYNGGK